MPTQKRFTEEETRERKNARQREYQKRTNYEATRKSQKETTKPFLFLLHIENDADIIEYIERQRESNIKLVDIMRELFNKYIKHKNNM